MDASKLAKTLCEEFAKGEFDALGIVCTRYVSILTQEAYVKWVLPLTKSEKNCITSSVFVTGSLGVLSAIVCKNTLKYLKSP